MVNNQTKGVYSAVYDWHAHGSSGWYFMGHVGPAPATRTDFTIDRDPDGQAWNDRVDAVRVC
jgi:hypothetical protein